MSDAPRRRHPLLRLLRPAVSTLLILVLLTTLDLGRVWAELAKADLGLLLLAFSLHAVGFTLSAIRWRLLLRAVARTTRLWLLMRAYLIGMFMNQFLPSTIGGDVYRGIDAAALTGLHKGRSLAIVVVERMIGALALFTYAVLAFLLLFGRLVEQPGVVTSLALLAAGFVAFFVLLTPWSRALARRLLAFGPLAKLIPSLEAAFGAVRDLGRRKRILAGAFLISLVFQANVVLHYVLVGLALDLELPLVAYFLAVPIVLLVLQLPVSLNGIGVREAAFVLFLGTPIWQESGAAPESAVAFSVLVFAMIIVQGLVGGIFFAARRRLVGALDTPEGA